MAAQERQYLLRIKCRRQINKLMGDVAGIKAESSLRGLRLILCLHMISPVTTGMDKWLMGKPNYYTITDLAWNKPHEACFVD